ncbi:MAG: DNA integrity scanning protein DisA nucleotide-binding domain protein [Clostridia bacterium]|nr:DNA integrity scanning protein DisA nucleotide-binding domain protein [Clostridia bacterium]
MGNWAEIKESIVTNFGSNFGDMAVTYVLQLILYTVLYYLMFKVLKSNKGSKFIPVIIFFVIFAGVAFASSMNIDSTYLLLVVAMIALIVFTMYHTEIKRSMLNLGAKKSKIANMTASGIDGVIDEIVRAVQNMSKNDVGALIVLSDNNLPEGIVESGTVINAEITSQMIEAVFYPKAPLHDGALILEGVKLYAAGCFLPIFENENLPKEMGSRHRAALGVTTVASVTAIVVSEETGIISIVKNGNIKRYADAADLKNALSEYYWTELSAEGK